MKFSCVKDHLVKAVSTAERFTGKNLTLPILGNILLEARANSLLVVGTNLESAVQVLVPGKTESQGKVVIPGKILNSFLQTMYEEKVEIEERQKNLFIKTPTRSTRVNGVDPQDFPLVPSIKKSSTFFVEAAKLAQSISKVSPSVSFSEFKPEITGIYFDVSKKSIKIASTDTFRLSEKNIALGQESNSFFSFIVPNRVMLEAGKIFQDKEKVEASIGESQVLFETEGTKIISRLIDGNFPEYASIIPKNFETTFFISKEEMVHTVRSSGIFASKIQDITLKLSKNTLEISSGNPEVGEYNETIPISFTGKEVSVSFNYRYLLDGIEVLEEEEIFIGLNGESLPSLFKNKSDNSFVYALMPIRTT